MSQVTGKKRGSGPNGLLSDAELFQLEIRSTLEATWMTTVRIVQSRDGTLRALFAIRPGLEAQWFRYLREIVPALAELPYDAWIGERYMLVDGRLVAPWVLSVETENAASLKRAIREIRKIFMHVVNGAVDEPRPKRHDWFADQLARRGDGLIQNLTIHPRVATPSVK